MAISRGVLWRPHPAGDFSDLLVAQKRWRDAGATKNAHSHRDGDELSFADRIRLQKRGPDTVNQLKLGYQKSLEPKTI
jgi:hypothetical protein